VAHDVTDAETHHADALDTFQLADAIVNS